MDSTVCSSWASEYYFLGHIVVDSLLIEESSANVIYCDVLIFLSQKYASSLT